MVALARSQPSQPQSAEASAFEIDILDGTPLLDIKPYSPYSDIFEVHRSGWLDAAMKREGVEKTVADERFFRPKTPSEETR